MSTSRATRCGTSWRVAPPTPAISKGSPAQPRTTRPTLQALPDDLRQDFAKEFRAALRAAYPRTDAGVVLLFRRVFAVARRHTGTLGS